MYMFRCRVIGGGSILINPKDVRWVKHYEEEDKAVIEFLNGEQVSVLCNDFNVLEQTILDASMPEMDLKTFDGLRVYLEGNK